MANLAHIKSGGTVKGNRDSIAKRLGVKKFTGEKAAPGNILIRQKGTKYFAGAGCGMGGDYTIFAVKTGKVSFKIKQGKKYVLVG